MAEPVLRVEHLTTALSAERGRLRAVDDVSFEVDAGRTLALVGESGAGKSVTALSLLRLLPEPTGVIERGRVLFEGVDLMTLPERRLRRVRGAGIALISQEPLASLDPVHTVGAQLVQVLRRHDRARGRAAHARAVELLERVGIPAAATRADAFPHELSAGMRQLVAIAMALACEPRVLIADEPTAALDVTTQAQILDRVRELQAERGMALVLVTRDLGVAAEIADEVAVMYAGRVVERGPVAAAFTAPAHPYTRALLAAATPSDGARYVGRRRRLTAIDGVGPDLLELGPGCRFADRCALRAGRTPPPSACQETEPELRALPSGGVARCHFPGEVA